MPQGQRHVSKNEEARAKGGYPLLPLPFHLPFPLPSLPPPLSSALSFPFSLPLLPLPLEAGPIKSS